MEIKKKIVVQLERVLEVKICELVQLSTPILPLIEKKVQLELCQNTFFDSTFPFLQSLGLKVLVFFFNYQSPNRIFPGLKGS